MKRLQHGCWCLLLVAVLLSGCQHAAPEPPARPHPQTRPWATPLPPPTLVPHSGPPVPFGTVVPVPAAVPPRRPAPTMTSLVLSEG